MRNITRQQEMQAVKQQATPRRQRTTLRAATAPIAEMLRSQRLAKKEVIQ